MVTVAAFASKLDIAEQWDVVIPGELMFAGWAEWALVYPRDFAWPAVDVGVGKGAKDEAQYGNEKDHIGFIIRMFMGDEERNVCLEIKKNPTCSR